MSRGTTIAAILASGTLTLSTISLPIAAQSTNSWRFQVTPYVWLTGIDGDVGLGPLETHVDVSVGDVLSALKFAAMLNGEARKGKWVLGFDALYASVGAEKVVAFRGDTGRFELTERETIIQPVGGYSFGDQAKGLDVLVGFRYWNFDLDLDVDRTRRPSNRHRSGSRQWVDATGGIRAHASIPNTPVFFLAGGDVGGGGSHVTWQAYGTADVKVSSRWVVGLGYRVLAVDYDRRDVLIDTRTKGFLVKGTYRF